MAMITQPDIQMPELPPDEEIVEACRRERDRRDDNSRCFVYPPKETPLAFIKYSDEAEMRNHKHILEVVAQMPAEERLVFRVPQIYRCIRKGGMMYIVMEYIKGQTVHELLNKCPVDHLKDELNRIFKAINSLLSIRVPQDIAPGPVGGGIIKHPIFKDGTASIEYNSVDHLQEHINKVANRMPHNNCKIDFSREKLCLCFSDLYEGNFMFTESGDLYLIDFVGLSYLPSSFMTYTLDQPRPICAAIKDMFDLPTNNLHDMKAAGYYFQICWRLVGLEQGDVEYEKIKERRKIAAVGME